MDFWNHVYSDVLGWQRSLGQRYCLWLVLALIHLESLMFSVYFSFVGPTIKGEIGDMIIITFRNAVTKVNGNFSVHPHGLFYTKSHEGKLLTKYLNVSIRLRIFCCCSSTLFIF